MYVTTAFLIRFGTARCLNDVSNNLPSIAWNKTVMDYRFVSKKYFLCGVVLSHNKGNQFSKVIKVPFQMRGTPIFRTK